MRRQPDLTAHRRAAPLQPRFKWRMAAAASGRSPENSRSRLPFLAVFAFTFSSPRGRPSPIRHKLTVLPFTDLRRLPSRPIGAGKASKMDDDDIPQLPADTLQLLQEFQLEKDARAKQFEDLKAGAENSFQHANGGKLSMDLFGEDWNTSQFWYTDATARTLAQQLLDGANESTHIAIVSAPSVYVALRNILAEDAQTKKPAVYLLEYDQRFEVLGKDFVPYDFQYPLRLPPELKGKFDRIMCDPPFLSEECQTKTALTVRFLARQWSTPAENCQGLRFISCTGERMAETIGKLYGKIGVKIREFEPEHSKGLSNEFRCYANFWRS
jgi:EEF1A lysine methyltransferase 1